MTYTHELRARLLYDNFYGWHWSRHANGDKDTVINFGSKLRKGWCVQVQYVDNKACRVRITVRIFFFTSSTHRSASMTNSLSLPPVTPSTYVGEKAQTKNPSSQSKGDHWQHEKAQFPYEARQPMKVQDKKRKREEQRRVIGQLGGGEAGGDLRRGPAHSEPG